MLLKKPFFTVHNQNYRLEYSYLTIVLQIRFTNLICKYKG